MSYLLDTHIFLWYITQNPRLSDEHKSIIQNPESKVYLSLVSVWECVIEQELGKLDLPSPASLYLPWQREIHQIESLSVTEHTLQYLQKLAPVHKDPFDRLLISQAQEHKLTLLTEDQMIRQYL